MKKESKSERDGYPDSQFIWVLFDLDNVGPSKNYLRWFNTKEEALEWKVRQTQMGKIAAELSYPVQMRVCGTPPRIRFRKR